MDYMLNNLNAPLIVNLCPTGMVVMKETCPDIPITPRDIAHDVYRCYNAGASLFHLHAREQDQSPTWKSSTFEEIISETKNLCPNVVIVVTTSGRNWSEFEKRSECLHINGLCKPDMASLTLGSVNFPNQASANAPELIKSLALNMSENNIVPELEVFDSGMANYARHLIQKGILKPPYYFNILLGLHGAASLSPLSIGSILAQLPEGATWALAGIGRYQLAANVASVALGGHVRVGLEDNPYFDWRNKKPTSNVKLVDRVVKIAREYGREPATPMEARTIIGLDQSLKVAQPETPNALLA